MEETEQRLAAARAKRATAQALIDAQKQLVDQADKEERALKEQLDAERTSAYEGKFVRGQSINGTVRAVKYGEAYISWADGVDYAIKFEHLDMCLERYEDWAAGVLQDWDCAPSGACLDGPEAPPQDAADHWAVKALARVVPVSWSDDSDGVCILRNAGRFYVTRTTALIFAIGWCDLTFSSDNITAILALTTDAFTITATMTLSILALRPVYFLCFAFVDYLDALDSALGVILVVIGGKLLLGLAGVEVPLWAVVLVLTVWRIGVAAYVFNKARSRV